MEVSTCEATGASAPPPAPMERIRPTAPATVKGVWPAVETGGRRCCLSSATSCDSCLIAAITSRSSSLSFFGRRRLRGVLSLSDSRSDPAVDPDPEPTPEVELELELEEAAACSAAFSSSTMFCEGLRSGRLLKDDICRQRRSFSEIRGDPAKEKVHRQKSSSAMTIAGNLSCGRSKPRSGASREISPNLGHACPPRSTQQSKTVWFCLYGINVPYGRNQEPNQEPKNIEHAKHAQNTRQTFTANTDTPGNVEHVSLHSMTTRNIVHLHLPFSPQTFHKQQTRSL